MVQNKIKIIKMKKILLALLLLSATFVKAQTATEMANIYGAAFNDAVASASISANATSGASIVMNGHGTAIFTFTGTFTATFQVQISGDGSTFTNVTASNQLINMASGSYMASGNITAVGSYIINCAGVNTIRIISTAYTSGTAVITARGSKASNIVFVAGVPNVVISSGTVTTVSTVSNITSIAQFAASAADADATTNITSTSIRDFGHYFNGTTWDRQHGNWNTTTGDAGTKTSSFTGATQTNYDSRGASITVLCGTVSGTSPTLTAQLQFSPDAGTTWINIGAASTAVTTTGNTITFQVYPANFSVAGATPAALTTGATTTIQLNTVLPRTWRLNYTIGGTTPSFAITAVYVNYQL